MASVEADAATSDGRGTMAEQPSETAAPGSDGPDPEVVSRSEAVAREGDASPGQPSETLATQGRETAPGASATVASSDLERLLADWRVVVAELGQHPPTRALINECRPIAVDGNVVTLGFPETRGFLKDIADRRRANLEEGIGRFLGHPVAVRCVATNLDAFAPLPGDQDGDRLVSEARRIFADDLLDVHEVS
jgi:hypothetical protein